MITLSSDSELIKVSDKWVENKDIEWKVSLFDKNASYHGISLSYPSTLSINEREVQVCLSGANSGEFHGVILMREEQVGNSVVQMGVWLKANITEPQTIIQPSTPSNSGGGGGGIAKANTTNTTNTELTNDGNLSTNNELKETGEEEQTSGITGAIIGGKGNTIIAIIFIAAILIATYTIYRRRRWKKFGY